MRLNLYIRFWIGGLTVSLATACHHESLVTPVQSNLLAKVIETRYTASQKPTTLLSHPPLLFQGTNYKYAFQVEYSYQYDSQGRLLEQRQWAMDIPISSYGPSSVESNWYSYVGNLVIHRRSIVGGQDTLTINEQGYAIDNFFLHNKTTYSYDQDGYLLQKQTPYQRVLQTIDQGNLSKQVIQDTYSTSTTDYDYDRNRASVPDPLALFAESKGSRNLLTKVRTSTNSSLPFYTDTAIVSTDYSYEFDERNRVKQQTSLTTNTKMSSTLILKTFFYSD